MSDEAVTQVTYGDDLPGLTSLVPFMLAVTPTSTDRLVNGDVTSSRDRLASLVFTANKKFNSPRNGSTIKKIDRERQYTTERTSKH